MTERCFGGYHGKILRINLSNREATIELTDEQFCQRKGEVLK